MIIEKNLAAVRISAIKNGIEQWCETLRASGKQISWLGLCVSNVMTYHISEVKTSTLGETGQKSKLAFLISSHVQHT